MNAYAMLPPQNRTMKYLFFKYLAALTLLVTTGCSTVHIPEGTAHKGALNNVFEQHVNEAGQVDFDGLKASPHFLNDAAYQVATADLSRLQIPEVHLAFYINGYNTLAMYHAVHSGWVPNQKIRFFLLSKLPIAGKNISLFNLENKVIRPLGDPRIHFVLNCMAADCPRLQKISYYNLDAQLDAAAREFLNQERYIRVDSTNNAVHCSKILKWYRKDFETDEQTLIQYINQYREEAIPEDYAVKWLPYDWSLNQSPPGSIKRRKTIQAAKGGLIAPDKPTDAHTPMKR